MTPRLRPDRIAPAAAVLVLALGPVACGAADDTGSTAGATTEVTAEARPPSSGSTASPPLEQVSGAVTVTAADFEFRVDEDGLRAGDVELTLVNDGGSTHDLVVERDGDEIAAVPAVDPGGSASLTVALEPGEYVLYCSIANHRAMGMETSIEVT